MASLQADQHIPPADAVGPRMASARGLVGTSILMVIVLTVMLGLIYPFVIMGIGQVVFNHQANGSLIKRNGRIVGSDLLGQEFTKTKYFWGRLSSTEPTPYNAAASSGSNLGPTNGTLLANTVAEAKLIRKINGLPKNYILPSDAVSSSASGLDPDISPAYAALQAPRVAGVRHLKLSLVRRLVQRYTAGRTVGWLGEPRVNVLQLNLALNRLRP